MRIVLDKLFNIKISLMIPLIILALMAYNLSYAKVYIDITSPASRRIPIAITEFKDLSPSDNSSTDLANNLREVLINDLKFSGLFDIIGKEGYIEDPERAGIKREETDFGDWRVIGSELLVKGGYKENPPKEECKKGLKVEVRLFDVIKEQVITGRKYCSNSSDYRRIMHKFANRILKELTGENGIFETRLVFVSTPSNNKEIYISDYDGYNIHPVTKNNSINLSPKWSPDGRWLLFTSFKDGEPKLYTKNPFTGREFKISNYPGINIGARWSPSGKEIALTLSIHGNPEIYTMSLKTQKLTRLTNNWGIDVSPAWSPDGNKIAFISDRIGKPHIFVVNANGKNLKRLTSKGEYNASPAWSLRGDKITFSRLNNGRFDIWVMNPDGTNQTQLTFDSGNNEDPSWAPNGRYIVFKSDREDPSSIYIMRADGTNQKRIVRGSNPSLSP